MTTASVDVENTVNVAELPRSSSKKVRVSQAELEQFKAKYAKARMSDMREVYFKLTDGVARLKLFNFMVVHLYYSLDELGSNLVDDAMSLDPQYVEACKASAAKRLASPRHKSH